MIVPTRDRRQAVLATLRAIDRDAAGLPIEVVVADDGSQDGSAEAIGRLADALELELTCVERRQPGGPAAARNSAIAVARAPVLLFLGDDMVPRRGLIAAHLRFHRDRPARGAALLGRIVPAPGSDTPFAAWLHDRGKQFAFAELSAESPVPARLFYAANLSLKASLLGEAGGFDERFHFGYEERELGRRLERAGIAISHDPAMVAEHDHPTDLSSTLRRMRGFGRSLRLLTELDDREPAPRRPGPRHRAASLLLAMAASVGLRRPGLRERTWRFLCEQASREAFWGEEDPSDPAIRIGRRLARIAERDPATRVARCEAAVQPTTPA